VTSAGRIVAGLLIAAVALAFADASIVVLALPPIYGELGTSVEGTSWVITTYAVAVTVVGALVLAFARRLPARPITIVGLALFAVGSVSCGVADTIEALVAARVVQGLGAALMLSGALPLLTRVHGPRRGVSLWATAAVAGLAAGPALGGALTEAFEWRSIFLAQAPVAVLALGGLLFVRPEAPTLPPDADVPGGDRPAAGALGLTLLSGALVGALFLGVLLIVEIWQHPPLEGAVIVSALPAALLVVRALSKRAGSPVARVVAGSVGLAGGLSALALLPTSSAGWAAAALGVCGAGMGLLDPVLSDAVLRGDAPLRTGALDVTARHAGLVLGLVLIAPVLAGDLEAATDRAVLAGAETVLDARLDVSTKIDVADAIGVVIDETEPGRMPDVSAAFADAAGEDDRAPAASTALVTRVEEVLTRAFRSSFLLAAGLALACLVPALLVARGRARPVSPLGWLGLAVSGAVAIAGIALPVAGWRAGGEDVGQYEEADACAPAPDPYSGNGFDPTLQRIALGALNGAACDLGLSRERLVLSVAGTPGFERLDLSGDELEAALEAGLLRATDDAEDRGHLPGVAARVIRGAARVAPLTLLLDGIERLDVVDLPF
jgi:MFS family permease